MSQIIEPQRSLWEKFVGGTSPQVKAALISAFVSLVLALITITSYLVENSRLKREISSTTSKVQELELELTPFRTLAIQKFSSADPAAMRQLANAMTRLQNDYSHALDSITQLNSQVETLRTTAVPRSLTPEQEKQLVRTLSKVVGVPVVIVSRMSDGESMDYGNQFGECIQKAGWEVSFNKLSLNDFKGVWVGYIGTNSEPTTLTALVTSLTEIGVPLTNVTVRADSIGGQLNGRIGLIVGRK